MSRIICCLRVNALVYSDECKKSKPCLEYDVLVRLEETEHAVEMKVVERGVEEITGECGHHTAEERHPAELETPE